jgi:hypothetical protein
MKQLNSVGKAISIFLLLLPFKSKAQADTLMPDSHVIFGIPSSTDDEWDGGHILRVNLMIVLKDGRHFAGSGEHRNTDVKKSRAIPIFITWADPSARKKITFENVQSVHIELRSFPGKPTGSDGNKCRCREETELKFSNGKVILTGYRDAQLLLPLGPQWVVERTTDRDIVGQGFEYNESRMLIDGKVN